MHTHEMPVVATKLSKSETIQVDIKLELQQMIEGDLRFFESDYDFSKDLIEVMQNHFEMTPFKAVFMQEGPHTWTIKVKYPVPGQGCCGGCG